MAYRKFQGNPAIRENEARRDDTAFPFDLTDCNIRVRIVLPNQMLEDVMSMRDYLPHVEALVAKMTLCNGTFGTDGKSALETVAADSIIRPRWNDRAGFQRLEFANAHTGFDTGFTNNAEEKFKFRAGRVSQC